MPRNQDNAQDAARKAAVDALLRLGRLIGWQRWGMVVLYYRAGLSQEEIGRVFGVGRQVVSYQLRRAFEILEEHANLDKLRARRTPPKRHKLRH